LIEIEQVFGGVGHWRQFTIREGKVVTLVRDASGPAHHLMHQLIMTLYCRYHLMWNGIGLRHV
jgi:hypothetical protein